MTTTAVSDETGRQCGLREAARALLDGMCSTYKARNGRDVGIEADDGEKCYIVHSDLTSALDAALSAAPVAQEPVAWLPIDTRPLKTGRYLVGHRGWQEVMHYFGPEKEWVPGTNLGFHCLKKRGWTWCDPRVAFGATHCMPINVPSEDDTFPPATSAGVGADEIARHSKKLMELAAVLSAERIQGWANPLVSTITDAVKLLKRINGEPEQRDDGGALLSRAGDQKRPHEA